jgi:hypothetical protein
MDWLSVMAARLAKWAAYSDYCMNSDFGLPHCRTFWTVAGVAVAIGVGVLAAYLARQFARGRVDENSGENPGGSAN